MRYFKVIKNGYILTIGTGSGGNEITEAEYLALYNIFMACPKSNVIIYDLRADTLEWEEIGKYTDAEQETMTETEEKALAYDILMGVIL